MAFSLSAANDPLNNQIVVFTYSGFTATNTGTIAPGDGSNTPITIFSSSGQIAYNYATTGTFTATAYDANNNVLGTATVTVTSVNQRIAAPQTQKGPIVEKPSQAPLATQAGYSASMTQTTDNSLQVNIQSDTTQRFVMDSTGKMNWGPGGAAATDANFYRSATGTLKTDTALQAGGDFTGSGNIIAATAGKGLQVKSGTNAKAGTVTLNGTTAVTVNTTAVTATSVILLGGSAPAGTPAGPYVSAVTPGTSFQVKSSAADTSVIGWVIVEAN